MTDKPPNLCVLYCLEMTGYFPHLTVICDYQKIRRSFP
nr:MAG TPA: hypothetical protein [Caudoviricetes sp.]